MRQHQNHSTPAGDTEVVTSVLDQLNNDVLLQLRGAVALPPGTIVKLADGTCARVESLRLIAPSSEAEPARLLAHVVRASDSQPSRRI